MITEVRIRPPGPDVPPAVLAIADVVLGGEWKIRDCRVVRLPSGSRRVVMPDRPMADPCPHPECRRPAPRAARFCPHCGGALPPANPEARVWITVAHPINGVAYQVLEDAVLAALDARGDAEVSSG